MLRIVALVSITIISTGCLAQGLVVAPNTIQGGLLQGTDVGAGVATPMAASTSRTLATRFADRYNALDWGADPTGVADSSPRFTAIATAIPTTGATIYIPAGTYRRNSTTYWPDNCSVVIDARAYFTGSGQFNTDSDPSVLTQHQSSITIENVSYPDKNSWGQYYSLVVPSTFAASFSGTISGTTLTITAMAYLSPPIAITGPSSPGYQFITGSGVTVGTQIVAFGTGTGGTGTYTININQTVSSTTAMTSHIPYEKSALYIKAGSYDPSPYQAGSAADFVPYAKDIVGAQIVGEISPGNSAGRAWGITTLAAAAQGGADGALNSIEADLTNYGVAQGQYQRFNSKNGLSIVDFGPNAATTGGLIQGAAGGSFYDGWVVLKGSATRYPFALQDLSTFPATQPFSIDANGNLGALSISTAGAIVGGSISNGTSALTVDINGGINVGPSSGGSGTPHVDFYGNGVTGYSNRIISNTTGSLAFLASGGGLSSITAGPASFQSLSSNGYLVPVLVNPPATSTAACFFGQYAVDNSYHYDFVSTNHWQRSVSSAW